MPNWAIGILEVSGKVNHILDFVTDTFGKLTIAKNNTRLFFNPIEEPGFYLGGTDRCYITDLEFHIELQRDCVCSTCTFNIECAWDIDTDGFKKLSEKYGLTFRAYVEEEGMGFTHTFECYGDNVEVDTVGEYVSEHLEGEP